MFAPKLSLAGWIRSSHGRNSWGNMMHEDVSARLPARKLSLVVGRACNEPRMDLYEKGLLCFIRMRDASARRRLVHSGASIITTFLSLFWCCLLESKAAAYLHRPGDVRDQAQAAAAAAAMAAAVSE